MSTLLDAEIWTVRNCVDQVEAALRDAAGWPAAAAAIPGIVDAAMPALIRLRNTAAHGPDRNGAVAAVDTVARVRAALRQAEAGRRDA